MPALVAAGKNGQRRAGWVGGSLGPGPNQSPGEERRPVLLQAIASPDSTLRGNAARALGEIGVPAKPAIPALVRMMKAEQRYDNVVAAEALA